MKTVCPCCDFENATESMREQIVEMNNISVKVNVPVISCSVCELDFIDYRAEDIKEQAIKNILQKTT